MESKRVQTTSLSLRRLVKDFAKDTFPGVTRKDYLVWGILISATFLLGCLIAYFSFREGFDFGDPSTFYQFARNISHGEAIYQNFIHFRTPGAYFFQALIIKLFGDQMSSLMLAIQLETHPFYVLIFGLGIALFLRFKHQVLGLITFVGVAFLPGVLSFRAALGFLTIMLYIQSLRTLKYRRAWLAAAGVFTGITFTFGQETAVMVIATIAITEICTLKKREIRRKLREAGIYISGMIVGLLPLTIYLLSVSSFGTFLYYTLYYAFILQPQGMDTAYPLPSYNTAIFFVVPALLGVSFYILYSAKRHGMASAALLVFGVARLVTLFGRSDISHLIFTVPDVIFISLFTLTQVKYGRYDKATFYRFIPFGVVFTGALVGAIYFTTSFWILVAMITIVLAFKLRAVKENSRWGDSHTLVYSVLFAGVVILGYCMFPFYSNTVDSMSKRGLTPMNIGGVNVTEGQYKMVKDVENAVAKYHPTTLFSFPIQPYYYTFAPHHAARFLTFEPQTTIQEQDETIDDLKRTKPDVVIVDPAQAARSSKSLWKISDFIMSNYRVEKIVGDQQILWIMTAKGQPQMQKDLVFSLYRLNDSDMSSARDMQSPDKGIVNGIQVMPGKKALFTVENGKNLQLSLYNDPTNPAEYCGVVIQSKNGARLASQQVCKNDGMVTIALQPGATQVTLENQNSSSIVFNEAAFLQ